MTDNITRLMRLFDGLDRAYGVYQVQGTMVQGQKQEGRAATKYEPVTRELWERHVDGTMGLGITPIQDDDSVCWGCIDVDRYNMDLEQLAGNFADTSYVLCRTKSGGLHIFLFVDGRVPAADMQRLLRQRAAKFGFGNSEVFPKQTELLTERGDVGSWLNMPYFDAEATMRYGLGPDGSPLSLEEFLDYAESKKVDPEDIVTEAQVDVPSHDLPGGPPCLNLLVKSGFPEGTRNDGLFALGVYARKSEPNNWEKLVEEFNRKYMDPPLTSNEVIAVIKSLKRKDYEYPCKRPPIMNYCNAAQCRLCDFGVGDEGGLPQLGSLTKLCTNPPIWFLDVEGRRLELETAELQNQRRFQIRCMDVLNRMPPVLTNQQWRVVVQGLLDSVNEVQVPEDASEEGMFWDMCEQFCTGRSQARTREEILTGKPFREDGRIYFRMADLVKYLNRQNFKAFKPPKMAAMMRDRGAKPKFWNIKGKGVNTWSLPEGLFYQELEQ